MVFQLNNLFSLVSYEPYTSTFKGQIFLDKDFPHTICMVGIFTKQRSRKKQLATENCPSNIPQCLINFTIFLYMMSKQITFWYIGKVVLYRRWLPARGGQLYCIVGLRFQQTATCSRQVDCTDMGLEKSAAQSSGTSRLK